MLRANLKCVFINPSLYDLSPIIFCCCNTRLIPNILVRISFSPLRKQVCVCVFFDSTWLLKDANQETAAEGELVENLQKLRKATHYRNELLRRAYRNQQPNAIYVNTPQSLDFWAKNKEAIPQHEMDISTHEHVGTSCSGRKRERSYRPIF